MTCARKFPPNLFHIEFTESAICIMDSFKVARPYDGFNEIAVSV